jgi:hypothetical protein
VESRGEREVDGADVSGGEIAELTAVGARVDIGELYAAAEPGA